jgi:predicted ATPase
MSLFHTAYLYYLLRDSIQAQQQAEAAMALGAEHGFPDWTVTSMLVCGWALAMQGHATEGLEQIRQGLAACQAIGIRLGWSGMAYQLAEAYGKAEHYDEGLRVIDEALQKIPQDGERCYETELYRLKGQLTLAQASVQSRMSHLAGKQLAASKRQKKFSVVSSQFSVTDLRPLNPDPQGEAEVCFHKAIEIARQKQAKSLELRATIDLARLWQQQGKHAVAHNTLSEIYHWFTEGFATPDLQEAQVLLNALQEAANGGKKSASYR